MKRFELSLSVKEEKTVTVYAIAESVEDAEELLRERAWEWVGDADDFTMESLHVDVASTLDERELEADEDDRPCIEVSGVGTIYA